MAPLLFVAAGCAVPETAPDVPGEAIFVDRAAETGLDFVQVSGAAGEYYYPEIMGPGGAFFDFDNDGDLDVYLVQSGHLDAPLGDRLYRNDLETGSLRFTDVSSRLRAAARYGVGVAAGDFDGDGRLDLYVTNFGPNQLLRNRADGTFVDVTEAAGTADERWSVAATFFDYDRDGLLDLYVGNYLDYTLATHKVCTDVAGAQDYCGPTAYRGVPDRLFRNSGGAFEDVSLTSGVGQLPGRSLGAVAADFDNDGWQDLYVANDGEPNFLWINQRHGVDGRVSFRDGALLAGCAVNEDGRPEASMGVALGDFDNDGDDDLFMTHLAGETNSLFRNEGGRFTDQTAESGLGLPSWPMTGFGTAWLDFDQDGWLDLMTVNGAVTTIQELAQAGDAYPFHQKKQLLRNTGGVFADVTLRAGAVFELSEVGRGAAFGDVDNDGDTDVLVINNNGPARLLLNTTDGADWIGVEPVGESGQVVLGARVEVLRDGGAALWRRASADGSYASANDPRVLFGLGKSAEAVDVRVHWRGGSIESWGGLAPGRYHRLRLGEGLLQEGVAE